MLNRVVADAELAVLLTNETTVKQEALDAIELVRQLRQKNQLPLEGR